MSTAYGLVWVVVVSTSHDYTSDTVNYLNAYSTYEKAVAFIKSLGFSCEYDGEEHAYNEWYMPDNYGTVGKIHRLYIDESIG